MAKGQFCLKARVTAHSCSCSSCGFSVVWGAQYPGRSAAIGEGSVKPTAGKISESGGTVQCDSLPVLLKVSFLCPPRVCLGVPGVSGQM